MLIVALFSVNLTGCKSPDTIIDDPNPIDTDVADTDVDTDTEDLDGDDDGYDSDVDCDDDDADIHPGAPETCDDVDQDCDGAIDEGLPTTWYHPDLDADGYGDARSAGGPDCEQPPYTSLSNDDCDDTRSDVFPGAPETVCDAVDSDCDGHGDDYQAILYGTEVPTVKEALALAMGGDTVGVCPGLHELDVILSIPEEGLTVSAWNGDATTTALTGDDTHKIVQASGWGTLTFEDLTFEHGLHPIAGDGGGGALDVDGGALVLDRCEFRNNASQWRGGAVRTDFADLTIRDSLFVSNIAESDGGAIYFGGFLVEGPDETEFVLEVTDTRFEANDSLIGSGGGIHAGSLRDPESIVITLTRVVFDGNSAKDGSGMSLSASGSTYTASVVDSEFVDNMGTGLGYCGALSWSGGGSLGPFALAVSGSTFDTNTGGALYLGQRAALDVRVDDTVFSANYAEFGGAVYISGGEPLRVAFTDTRFDGNGAVSGGAAYFRAFSGTTTQATFTDCTFTGQTVTKYGAVAMVSAASDNSPELRFDSCTVTDNIAAQEGGGIWHDGNLSFTSVDSWWGDATDDNSPEDIFINDVGVESFTDEDFSCVGAKACTTE